MALGSLLKSKKFMKALSILFALIALPFLSHAQIEVKEINGKPCIVQTQTIETTVADIDRKIVDVESKIAQAISVLNGLNNDKAALVEIRGRVKAIEDAKPKEAGNGEVKKETTEPPKRE